jgi:flagellin-like hook-associated protein FlgL
VVVRIGSNISSLQAQRRLSDATTALGTIFERLSSGQRINRAADDAAGLAIASSLNTNARVYTQAVRNGNDGLSALSIADGTVQELTGVVIRITELATQSANGTYSKFQRKALDAEAQALSKEFLRISKSTAFNGTKLFDGSLGTGLRLQLGYGVEGSINAGVGGAIGTGRFAARSTTTTGSTPQSVTLGDLNGDGVLDMVTADSGGSTASILLGNGDGTFKARTTVQTGANPLSVTLGDLNGDGVLDIVTADSDDSTASIMLGNGNGTFKARTTVETGAFVGSVTLGDLNGDGVLDIVTADYGDSTASIMLGNGNGTFRARTTVQTGAFVGSVTLGDLNGDGILDIVTADGGADTASILLGNGDGTFTAHTTVQTGLNPNYVTLGDLNGDGYLDIVSSDGSDGTASILLGNGNGTFKGRTTVQTGDGPSSVTLGDLNGDGVLDIVTAESGDSTASILLAETQSGLGSLLDFSLETRADSLQALGMLRQTLSNLAKQRGTIGSFQSRLGVALSNLQSGIENFKAAESRIRDTDVAADSAALIRTQILQQAGASVLAQANQQPQLALQLLRA